MWPGEGAIGQRQDGDDHEEHQHPHQASQDVVMPVRVIPSEGGVGEAQDTEEHQADCVRLVEKFCQMRKLTNIILITFFSYLS